MQSQGDELVQSLGEVILDIVPDGRPVEVSGSKCYPGECIALLYINFLVSHHHLRYVVLAGLLADLRNDGELEH